MRRLTVRQFAHVGTARSSGVAAWCRGRSRLHTAKTGRLSNGRSSDQATAAVHAAAREGTATAWRIYEDEAAVAFLDIGQATEGHTLVVPRTHAPDVWTLSEDDAAAVMRAVHRVAGELRDALRPEGLNVTQSNGAAAWQDVFHYHVHLVPRYGNDDLTPPWRPTSPTADELAEVHCKITGE